MSRPYARKTIRPEMTVRQIAADLPTTQAVFQRYGERPAPPARFGHLEPVTHFARRKGISLEKLFFELAAATGVPVDRQSRFDEQVHHGFIFSALMLTLTLGAGFGVGLLWQIAMQGDFHAVPAAYVIAHGEAQLWGFIVLFVMGIALRTVLQGVARHPMGVWICRGLLALALAGVGGSTLWSLFPESFPFIGIVSSTLLLLMSVVYWTLQVVQLRTKWRATWVRVVLISGLWLSAWAAVTTWYRWNAGAAGLGAYSSAQRILLIELAVFGFAMNSIYGFGQKFLPGLLRTGTPRHWAIELAHWLHNAGTIVVCLTTGFSANSLGMLIGGPFLVGGALLFTLGHHGFVGRRRIGRRHVEGHASLDLYPPLAFFWLLFTLTLMSSGALFEAVTASPLPHAFIGAMRHALTVGFMTTLILGVGQRVLPVLDHTVLSMPKMAVPIFVLIGFGNLFRVCSELAILLTPAAFRVMPVSGFLEWFALLLFASCILTTIYHRDSLFKRRCVTARSSLATLVAEYPWIEDNLRPIGTHYLTRVRSVPGGLTIGSFAQSENLAVEKLVFQINNWLAMGPRTEDSDASQARGSEYLESEV